METHRVRPAMLRTPAEKLAVSYVEAAATINVRAGTIANLVSTGELQSFTVRRSRCIPVRSIHAFIERRCEAEREVSA